MEPGLVGYAMPCAAAGVASCLQSEEFTQTLGLGAADGNFGLLLIVHTELIGALEPGDDFADAVDIDEVGAVGPPEQPVIEAVQEFFQSAAVGLAFHAGGAGSDDGNYAFFDGSVADVFLADEEEATGGFEQDLGGLRLLRLEHLDRGFDLV